MESKMTEKKEEKELKWGGYIGTNTRCFVCGRTEDEINQIVRDNFKLRGGVGDSHLSQDEIDKVEVMVYDPLCDMALPLEISKIGMVYFRISLCQVCEQLFTYLAHSKIGQWASILSRDIESQEGRELKKCPELLELAVLLEKTGKKIDGFYNGD